MTIPLLMTLASFQNEAPKVKLEIESGPVVAGGLAKAVVSLTFAPGLHGYQNPPSEDYMIPVEVKSVDGGVKYSVRYPKGEPAVVGGETSPVMTYHGTVKIPVFIRVPQKTGKQPVKVSVGYQQCTDQACFPPGTVTAVGELEVKAAPSGWNAVKQRSYDLLALRNF